MMKEANSSASIPADTSAALSLNTLPSQGAADVPSSYPNMAEAVGGKQ